jgi:hypothetical protein
MSIDIQSSPEPVSAQLTPPEPQKQEFVFTGGSPRYSLIDHEANTVTVMSSLSGLSQVSPEIEREFYVLAQTWRNKTAHLSLDVQRASDFDYQQIIGMGNDALPLIFREIKETTSDWFWALAAIARNKAPVIPVEAEGDVDGIAAIWLQWGKDNGYVAR